MRILQELRPAKRATWQLARVTWGDGRVGFHTGDDLFKRAAWWGLADGLRRQGAAWAAHANVVVEAALRPFGGTFIDRDDGLHYWANQTTAFAICEAAILGRVPIEDGHIVSRFTFRNQSGKISIALWDEANGAVAEAPDLTEFLKDMRAAENKPRLQGA